MRINEWRVWRHLTTVRASELTVTLAYGQRGGLDLSGFKHSYNTEDQNEKKHSNDCSLHVIRSVIVNLGQRGLGFNLKIIGKAVTVLVTYNVTLPILSMYHEHDSDIFKIDIAAQICDKSKRLGVSIYVWAVPL